MTADGEQRHGRRRQRARPLLGLARRRRRLRDRHRASTSTCFPSPRSTRAPRLPGRARRRRGPGLPRLGRRGLRTRSPRSSASCDRRRLPDVPEPLRGRPLLTIDGACIGSQEEGEATIAPLRELGEPIMDTFGQMPTAGLSADPHGPREPGARDRAHDGLSRAARRGDRRLRRRRRGRTPARRCCSASSATLGGALGRPDENGGALSQLDADFAMYGVGMPMTPELGRRSPPTSTGIEETMAPWGADGGYFNFTERPSDVDRSSRRSLHPAARGQGPVGPGREDRRQPRPLCHGRLSGLLTADKLVGPSGA